MLTITISKMYKWLLMPIQDSVAFEPSQKRSEFTLFYKNIEIGRLTYCNKSWTFEYTSQFKSQNEIVPIIDFPDKTKSYNADTLFPFFASRIPSIQRLKAQKIKFLKESDEVELLKIFGKKVITNPYLLSST